MKKIISYVRFVALCGFAHSLLAAGFNSSVDAAWSYSVTRDGVKILSYKGKEQAVCIPETISRAKVCAIEYGAFMGKEITHITIPDGVVSIGANAFLGCEKLMEANIPDTVAVIERGAFKGCRSLKKIRLPANLKRLQKDVLSGCSSLQVVCVHSETIRSIPSDIRVILGISGQVRLISYGDQETEGEGTPAESRCVVTNRIELVLKTSVSLPDELATTNVWVEEGARLALPTNIVARASKCLLDRFHNKECPDLYDFRCWVEQRDDAEVRRGHTPTKKYANGDIIAPEGDMRLTATWKIRRRQKITFRTSLGDGGIFGTNFLEVMPGESLTLPTEIVERASCELSHRMSVMGWRRKYDFLYWEGPDGLRFEDGATLTPTEHLKELTAVWKPRVAYRVWDNDSLKEVDIPRDHHEFEIPSDVRNISPSARNQLQRLRERGRLKGISVSPENDVFEIRNGALFRKERSDELVCLWADDIRDLRIPDGVTSIGENAFCSDYSRAFDSIIGGSTNIVNVAFPQGVKNIGRRAFKGCQGIKTVTFPPGITNIADGAFAGCSGLKALELCDVESIGNRAFGDCENLVSVVITGGTTTIASSAFDGCKSLTNIVVSASMEDLHLDGLCGSVHVTIPSSIPSVSLAPWSASCNVHLTIVTSTGRVAYDVSMKEVNSEWEYLRKRAEYETQSKDRARALLYPADALCDSHPSLYRDLFAGSARWWCWWRLQERPEGDRNSIAPCFDSNLDALTAVEIKFPDSGVSYGAIVNKYKEKAVGEFWIKEAVGRDRFDVPSYLRDSTTAKVVIGDDELLVRLAIAGDKVIWAQVNARKLQFAIAEQERKAKEASQKRLDDAALDF